MRYRKPEPPKRNFLTRGYKWAIRKVDHSLKRHELELKLGKIPNETWRLLSDQILIHDNDHLMIFKSLPQYFTFFKSKAETHKLFEVIVKELFPLLKGKFYEESMESNYIRYLFRDDFPPTFESGISVASFENILKFLKRIDSNLYSTFFVRDLPHSVIDNKLTDDLIAKQIKIANQYLDRNPDFYYQKVVIDNFGQLIAPDEKSRKLPDFGKSGGKLIPIGGKANKYMIKILPTEGYEAWKRVRDAGIPVEEIVYLNGRPMAYPAGPGEMRVYVKHSGTRLYDFKKQHPEYEEDLDSQMLNITRRLYEIGVERFDKSKIRNHPLESNCVVEMINGRPVVKVIDFDYAYIVKK